MSSIETTIENAQNIIQAINEQDVKEVSVKAKTQAVEKNSDDDDLAEEDERPVDRFSGDDDSDLDLAVAAGPILVLE